MVPPLRTTLGVKGHRPVVGNLDCHAAVYVFGALTRVSGHLTTRITERCRAQGHWKKRLSGQGRRQKAFARHLRDIARVYPAVQYPHVRLVSDNAPWHRGAGVTKALQECRNLALYRWPSYSPQLQVSERFWQVLRRRATHNRRFQTLAALKRALRNRLCSYQTFRARGLSLIESEKNRSKLSAP
jgi:transposase